MFHVEPSMPNQPPVAEGEVAEVLANGLAELGLDASRRQRELLATFTDQVADWGARLNLTGHREPQSIAKRLVLAAAALSTRLPDSTSLNDLGSGAGFPGIPIAILRPACGVHLVEARERRYHFLRDVARRLGIPNLSCERGRIERLEPRPAAAAVAQAVGPAHQVLEWMLPWVQPGGWLALPASQASDCPTDVSGVCEVTVHDYLVPLGGPRQRLWLARRVEA